jgi:hypothetical protein
LIYPGSTGAARRLNTLEDENAKLKRMLADAMLDNVALKDLLGKSGDARRASGSCGVSAFDLRDERAAGVPGDRGGPGVRAAQPDGSAPTPLATHQNSGSSQLRTLVTAG